MRLVLLECRFRGNDAFMVTDEEDMSRSRRYRPHCGNTTAVSEKLDKRLANRRVRHAASQILAATGDGDRLKHYRALSDPWSMDKDGKQRFDPREHPRLMRK